MSPVRPLRLALAGLSSALLALPLALLPATARAEWRDIPYADVAKMPLMLDKLDPQHIYRARLVARPGKGLKALPADFRLQVKVNGQIVPVPVSVDGSVQLPIRRDWAEAGAMIQSNQPKGTVSVSMNFDARTPPGTRMSYAKLTESAPVLERGISEMAGFMSFMAPDVKALVLKWEQPGHTAVLTLPDGRQKRWKADARGRIELPWEPKWAAGMVELSAPLAGIDQIMK
jgi:hypothetical protein